MADLVDMASEIEREAVEREIAAARRAPFDPGTPGQCDDCGDEVARLVDGRCAPCREPRGPKPARPTRLDWRRF